jgi:pimeloyl-ACP methyl ester carboxylesterase
MRIDNNGVGLAVGDAGTGTPVVLLHGWPDTGQLWRHQVPDLVADGYRAITPDLRGFGDSDHPRDVAAYAAPHLLADLVAVLDALGVARAHLVGHDWGAAISWLAAALLPDRVASLTALSVGHPTAFRSAGIRQWVKSWYMLLFQFPAVAERWLADDDFRNLREWSRHPDVDSVVARLADPAALTASLGVYRAMMKPSWLVDPPPQLPPIQAPVMGVWSSQDIALTEQQMTGSSGQVTGEWRYERLEDVGHWLPLEAPDALSGLLLDFLGKHRSLATG